MFRLVSSLIAALLVLPTCLCAAINNCHGDHHQHGHALVSPGGPCVKDCVEFSHPHPHCEYPEFAPRIGVGPAAKVVSGPVTVITTARLNPEGPLARDLAEVRSLRAPPRSLCSGRLGLLFQSRLQV